MPPVITSLSIPSASRATLSFLSLPLSSYTTSSPTPQKRSPSHPKQKRKPTVFGIVLPIFSAIETLCKNIMTVWRWVYPIHQKNTNIAQSFIDEAYLQYNQEEWEDKSKIAQAQMMRTVAMRTPLLFVTNWILDKEEGSEERIRMTGLLKLFNPEYYEANKEVLGEAMDWDQLRGDDSEEAYSDAEDFEEDLEAED